MKYEITNTYYGLRIYNENDNQIFTIAEDNYWFKSDYDQNGYRINDEDSNGKIIYRRASNRYKKIIKYEIYNKYP